MIDIAFTELPNIVVSRRLEEEQRQQKTAVIATMLPLGFSYSKNNSFIQQKIINHVELELALLKENWDGYGACSIDKNVIEHTLFIFNQVPNALMENVRKEDILPTSNGTITIEWNNNSNELLLEVGKNFSTYYIQSNGYTKKINNQFVITDIEQMRTFTKELRKYFFD